MTSGRSPAATAAVMSCDSPSSSACTNSTVIPLSASKLSRIAWVASTRAGCVSVLQKVILPPAVSPASASVGSSASSGASSSSVGASSDSAFSAGASASVVAGSSSVVPADSCGPQAATIRLISKNPTTMVIRLLRTTNLLVSINNNPDGYSYKNVPLYIAANVSQHLHEHHNIKLDSAIVTRRIQLRCDTNSFLYDRDHGFKHLITYREDKTCDLFHQHCNLLKSRGSGFSIP